MYAYLEARDTVVHVEGSVGLHIRGKRVDVDIIVKDGTNLHLKYTVYIIVHSEECSTQ